MRGHTVLDKRVARDSSEAIIEKRAPSIDREIMLTLPAGQQHNLGYLVVQV